MEEDYFDRSESELENLSTSSSRSNSRHAEPQQQYFSLIGQPIDDQYVSEMAHYDEFDSYDARQRQADIDTAMDMEMEGTEPINGAEVNIMSFDQCFAFKQNNL